MWVRLGSTDLMAGKVMFLRSNQGGRFDGNESVADSFRSDLVNFKSSCTTILGAFYSFFVCQKKPPLSGSSPATRGNRDYTGMWVRLGSTDLMAGKVMFLRSNQGGRFDGNESVADSFRSDLVNFKSSCTTILGAFYSFFVCQKKPPLSGSSPATRGQSHPSLSPSFKANNEHLDVAIGRLGENISEALVAASKLKFKTAPIKLPPDNRSKIRHRNRVRRFWQRSRDPALKNELRTISNEIASDIRHLSRARWEKI
ncbi:hypothetical protein TNCV_3551111 [Trichonephila clavipes]|nr:hypothetical protein TNCV_3551111 [Trichonephila clavipes]